MSLPTETEGWLLVCVNPVLLEHSHELYCCMAAFAKTPELSCCSEDGMTCKPKICNTVSPQPSTLRGQPYRFKQPRNLRVQRPALIPPDIEGSSTRRCWCLWVILEPVSPGYPGRTSLGESLQSPSLTCNSVFTCFPVFPIEMQALQRQTLCPFEILTYLLGLE